MQNGSGTGRKGRQWLLIFLLIPLVATLWIPFYASSEPSFQGIPYFYWYQFLWVLITAVLTAIVYVLVG